ncbi:MAG: ATP-binding protein [Oscillatoriales cyanobacterium RM2_1_1]|nr:ATP-binding protein [Oscillatoriales cyanobacterium RM2_1_1]
MIYDPSFQDSKTNHAGSIDLLREAMDQIFTHILANQTSAFESNAIILGDRHSTLLSLIREIQPQKAELTPDFSSDLELISGREDYARNQDHLAIQHYQNSLQFCLDLFVNSAQHLEIFREISPETSRKILLKSPECFSSDDPPIQHLVKLGIVLFHLGLSHLRLGEFSPAEQAPELWEKASIEFHQALKVFQRANRLDLVAKWAEQLIIVYSKLGNWQAVKDWTQQALDLHLSYGSADQIVQDYRWLAETAMQESKWSQASQLAELAFEIQQQSSKNSFNSIEEDYPDLLLLAKSHEQREDWQISVNQLEAALQNPHLQQDSQAYIQVLKALRKLYLDRSEYGNASHLKAEQLQIEYQSGLRSFVGVRQLQPALQSQGEQGNIAREILNSDRLLQVHDLIDRIQHQDLRLLVLYGDSGVGKSSLLTAGVIPQLLHRQLTETKIATPILLRVYTDWLREPNPDMWKLNRVMQVLEKNCDRQSVTILIFDQFEEFFSVCKTITQRLPFYQFLQRCLSLNEVKVLLVMRTDYLHYLLECDRWLIYRKFCRLRYYLVRFCTA